MFASSKGNPNAMKLRQQLISQAILIVILISVIFPLTYVVGMSLNPDQRRPTRIEQIFPTTPTLDNYRAVLTRPTANPVTFLELLGNSLFLAIGAPMVALLISVFAAYSFSRFRYTGRREAMIFIFALQLIPGISTLLPLYILLNSVRTSTNVVGIIFLLLGMIAAAGFSIWLLGRIRDREAGRNSYIVGLLGIAIGVALLWSGWSKFSGEGEDFSLRNSLYGVAVAIIAGGLPFAVWNLKGYLDTVPKELEEAALIDGASFNQTFFRIILPLAAPALAVTLFLMFQSAWTEFYLSWQFLTEPKDYTLAMTMWNITGQYAANISWGIFSAFAIMLTIPVAVVYAFFQRQIVGGLTSGGVKG
jgi:arabinogalactan oligomer/maltooligosaccharide transport system permease protein